MVWMATIMIVLMEIVYLESDEEEVVGQGAGQGEHHLREDKQADAAVITAGDVLLTHLCQVVRGYFLAHCLLQTRSAKC